MTVITSSRNPEDLSMTVVAEFDAPPERVWNVWEDPRKLERWWGPPNYPATFTRYEFEPGGECRYYMTGPEDFMHHGWWRIDALDAPRRIEFVNGLAGDDGEPVPGRRADRGVVTFEPIATGTRMTVSVPVRRRGADGAARDGYAGGHERRDRPDRRAARAPPRRLIATKSQSSGTRQRSLPHDRTVDVRPVGSARLAAQGRTPCESTCTRITGLMTISICWSSLARPTPALNAGWVPVAARSSTRACN